MADRYWVGGTADWDGTAGTKWAATSGGAGGETIPTSADDVYFDANSGVNTITIAAGNTGAKSINCTGFTGTLAGGAALTVAGSVTLVAGMTVTYNGVLSLAGTGTLTSAGKTLGALDINSFGVPGITVTLGDALTLSSYLVVTEGTFTTANYNIQATVFQSSGSLTRAINLGSSTITLTSGGSLFSGVLDFGTNTNLTFNAGTSSIVLSVSASTNYISGGIFSTIAFYDITILNNSAVQISYRTSFNNFTINTAALGRTLVSLQAALTINGVLTATGSAGNRRVRFSSEYPANNQAQTLTLNSTPVLTNVDFEGIYVIGTAAPISGTRLGNLGNVTGVTFSSTTRYWNQAAGGNWSSDSWAATPGGAVSFDNFPLPQDTAVIGNTGLNSGATITLDSDAESTFGISTIDMSTRTNAMTIATGAGIVDLYGGWKNGSGTTVTGSGILRFTGGQTISILSAGKTFPQGIIVSSAGGTVELADALVLAASQTLSILTGTFDTKNFNVTVSTLSTTGTDIREIRFGSSTITVDTSLSLGTTNLTFSAGTSQINLSSNTASIPSGLTYYNVAFTAATTGTRTINSGVYNNLSVTAPTTDGVGTVSVGGNITVSGTLTVAGSSPVRRLFLRSSAVGTVRTLNVATLSATDCDFRDITITGAAAGASPTRAGDCGNNSGITFPAPKTVYWNLAGIQNWSATAWAPGSGGTPNVNNFPLAQDTAVFDNTGSVTGAISLNGSYNIGTFNASARTTAMTLTVASNTYVYGDWIFGTGVTTSSASSSVVFAKPGTQTITSNGRTFNCPVVIESTTGTAQLGSAITVANSRNLTLISGTFNAAIYNVTVDLFSTSGTVSRTLKMGSGTWAIPNFGTCWAITSSTNLTFLKETANIILSGAGTSSRTFAGGGLSYNRLTIGGATGSNTTTITGNNQFTELASTKPVAHTIALGTTTQTFGRWTVTGTLGNVVTLTGTGTSHILAGSCTSGINYLAMGSIGFAATSPGEFYAGVNSTGTAGAPVYRTAKPADSTRYWVGGTGNWSDTARWSTSSGGAGGASVPRSHDAVVFNSASSATGYTATVNTVTGGIRMKSLTIAGPASGNVTLAGSTAIDGIHGNVTLPATGMTRTYTGAITLSSNSTGLTITTNGVALASAITVNGVDCVWSLGSALDMGTSTLTITTGTFDLSTYSLTAGLLSSNNTNSRTINFNAGTATFSQSGPIDFGITEVSRTNLTVTAGTSQINCSNVSPTFFGNNKTFYNVSFTGTSAGTVTINGVNSFNNLSFTGLTSAGLKVISLSDNQTVTGTLTVSAGTDATMRQFVRSNTLGTPRTITAAAFSGTDADFQDLTITGAAAPVSGTRLGDCKGNSGITFPSPKTVYVRSTGSANWSSSTGWSATEGGAADVTQFPLAQDTVIFPAATYPSSGSTITIDQSYNIGTIDMSLRTSNTVTLSIPTAIPAIYGNWINGTGTTGGTTSGGVQFSGRGAQTITSAGNTIPFKWEIASPGGTVTLQDAWTSTNDTSAALVLSAGTFATNGYTVALTGSGGSAVTINTTLSTTLALGSGLLSLAGTGTVWNLATPSVFSITGSGTIAVTSAASKTFAGGGIDYGNITLDQAGSGTLIITGDNTFGNIASSYVPTVGSFTISFGTTTQRVRRFTASGAGVSNVLNLQGSTGTNTANLIFIGTTVKPNSRYLLITTIKAYPLTATWYAGSSSNFSPLGDGALGWIFAQDPNAATGNFFLMFG